MPKKIIILAVIAAIAISFFVVSRQNETVSVPTVGKTEKENLSAGGENIKIKPQLPEQMLPFSNDPKDVAWRLFQKYLTYAKNRDLDGVKSVVYKVAPVCANPDTKEDCDKRMDLAYYFGSNLKKENFTNVWRDEKQIILSSDYLIEENDISIRRIRAIIFFVKDQSGALKMLSFSPFKGAVADKGAASKEELNDRLVRYTEDRDEDGREDYDEECLVVKEGETCVKTDFQVRDTDSDGWWDGVEILFR